MRTTYTNLGAAVAAAHAVTADGASWYCYGEGGRYVVSAERPAAELRYVQVTPGGTEWTWTLDARAGRWVRTRTGAYADAAPVVDAPSEARTMREALRICEAISKRLGPDSYKFKRKVGHWRTVNGHQIFFPDDKSAPLGMPAAMAGKPQPAKEAPAKAPRTGMDRSAQALRAAVRAR
jgi:hypothetical protein